LLYAYTLYYNFLNIKCVSEKKDVFMKATDQIFIFKKRVETIVIKNVLI